MFKKLKQRRFLKAREMTLWNLIKEIEDKETRELFTDLFKDNRGHEEGIEDLVKTYNLYQMTLQ